MSVSALWGQEPFEEGFEEGAGNLPAAWQVHADQPFDEVQWVSGDPAFVRNGTGSVKLVNTNPDRDGHLYLRAEVAPGHDKMQVLEFYAKGQGSVGASLYLYQGAEDTRSFLKTVPLAGESGEAQLAVESGDEWVKCRFLIPPGSLSVEATSIRPVLMAHGTVYIDDLTLGEEGVAKSAKKQPEVRPNLAPVARVTAAPRQDGVIEEGEYPVSFTGLIDNKERGAYARPNRVGLGSDGERFYLAAEIQVPAGVKPGAVPVKRDETALVAARPAFFLVMRPEADAERQGFEAAYLAVEPAGGFYDAWENVSWEKGTNDRSTSFQADWQIKTELRDGRWVVELSVPWRDLKIDPAALPQALCSFGFHLPETIVSWQMVGSWFDHPFAFGLLDLKADAPAVRVDALGALGLGQVAPQFVLQSRSAAPAKFEAQAVVSRPKMIGGKITSWVFSDFKKGAETVDADKPLLQWTKDGELVPQGSAEVGETKRLDQPGSYVLENQLLVGGQPVFYQKLPFRFSEPVVVALTAFPARSLLRAKIGVGGSRPDEKESVVVTAKSAEGKIFWEQNVRLSGDEQEVEIPLEPLQIGKNVLDFQLLAKDGTKGALLTESFTKREDPDWLKKRAGIEALSPEWAPQPWGPIAVNGNDLTVWGRKFSFAPGALVGGLTSQGVDLLKAPAVFKYRANGQDLTVALTPPVFESVHPGRVVITQKGETPAFQMTVRQTIEFDGMDAIEVQLTSTEAASIDALWLELPLRVAELSTFVTREGSSGFAYEHGLFDLTVPGINRPRSIANLWIGDEKVGLSFFTENYKGWLIDSNKPRVTAREEADGSAVLQIHLVNDPTALPQSTTMQFGLQPSPYRPKFTDYRKWRWGDRPAAPVNLWYTSGQMWTANDLQHEPRSWPFMEELCRVAQERELSPLLYICGFATSPWEWISRDLEFDVSYYQGRNYPPEALTNETAQSTLNPDYAYFHEDWNLRPRNAALFEPPTREQVFFSAGTSWADYAVHHIEQLLKRTSIQGFFFDISYPNTNYDPTRDLGYQTKDGVAEGTNEFMAARDMWKRIYYVFTQHRGPETHPWIMGHSFASTAPLSSFFDGAVNGEEIKPLVGQDFGRMASQSLLRGAPIARPEKENRQNYDGAAYRAIFGSQFGPVNFILPQYAYLPELKNVENTRDMLAATFVHNTQLWNAYVESDLIYEFWSKVEVPFGMGDTEFSGYWENGVQASPAGIKVSYWKKPDSADYLVAVANWTDQAEEAEVKLPAALLSAGQAIDLESGQPASLNAAWRIKIPPHDLRVFRIRDTTKIAHQNTPSHN